MFTLIFCLCVASSFALGAVVFGEDVQVPPGPVNVPKTTETLVVSGFSVTLPSDHGKAVIRGWVEITPAPGTTAITIAVYRGPVIAGSPIATKQPESGDFTPGSNAHFDVEFIDLLSGVSGAQYCMSVTQTGANQDGTVTAALIDTVILSG